MERALAASAAEQPKVAPTIAATPTPQVRQAPQLELYLDKAWDRIEPTDC